MLSLLSKKQNKFPVQEVVEESQLYRGIYFDHRQELVLIKYWQITR